MKTADAVHHGPKVSVDYRVSFPGSSTLCVSFNTIQIVLFRPNANLIFALHYSCKFDCRVNVFIYHKQPEYLTSALSLILNSSSFSSPLSWMRSLLSAVNKDNERIITIGYITPRLAASADWKMGVLINSLFHPKSKWLKIRAEQKPQLY